jgi:hypothetical protein
MTTMVLYLKAQHCPLNCYAMKKIFFVLLTPLIIFSSCSKGSKDDTNDVAVNSWTFTEGSKTFSGLLLFDAQMSSTLQPNNSYTFSMLGAEPATGNLFNLILSLLDNNFTVKTYKSGVAGNDYLNAFYYSEFASTDNIYKSSNLDPGPIMNYTITAYDAAKDIVTIEFSGQAQLANGSLVTITKGKVKAQVER